MSRDHQICVQLAALVHDIQGRENIAVSTAFDELAASAADNIPGAQYAGVTMLGDRQAIQLPASTPGFPALLDDIQERHGQGPCLHAATHQEDVHVEDLRQDFRWPIFRAEAAASTPIRSMMCFGLPTGPHTFGALNLLAEEPNSFSTEIVTIGHLYGAHIALVCSSLQRTGQFQRALASRDTIGQAKGLIMERFELDADQAFGLLRRLSQRANSPVRDVAGHLVVAHDARRSERRQPD